ncbi:hypothetical protein CLF_105396 [Clonorchis sinensis]|uniref:Gap-Pol polyprotein n=1 Tax=Clonorchis sinensis TaxID=79923 RepID=G7YP94_CLOSI|nr:hypothetical protein CLF_105396 [Clonorchis sinensis]
MFMKTEFYRPVKTNGEREESVLLHVADISRSLATIITVDTTDEFVEDVQPALDAQLRLARATGQLSVEHLMHLARELAEAPLVTFQTPENREDSAVEDLKNKVDQLTKQLAAAQTESRRHARTSRYYKCGTPGHWKKQYPRTRPLVHNKILEYSPFPEWVAISALA